MSRARRRTGHPNVAATSREHLALRADQAAVDLDGSRKALDRLMALTDGVFAFAMTLLVVDITLPSIASGAPTADLAARLWELRPAYLSYLISFVVISSYWLSHRRMFEYIVRADAMLFWLNTVLLLCIAFQPFPTRVLGQYGGQVAVVGLYAGTLAVTGLVMLAMWIYATTGQRLVSPTLPRRMIHYRTARLLAVPLVFLGSTIIAQANATLAEYSWIAISPSLVILRWVYRPRP